MLNFKLHNSHKAQLVTLLLELSPRLQPTQILSLAVNFAQLPKATSAVVDLTDSDELAAFASLLACRFKALTAVR